MGIRDNISQFKGLQFSLDKLGLPQIYLNYDKLNNILKLIYYHSMLY